MDLPPEVVLDQEDDAETDESESRNPRAVTTRMPSWRGVAHAVIPSPPRTGPFAASRRTRRAALRRRRAAAGRSATADGDSDRKSTRLNSSHRCISYAV